MNQKGIIALTVPLLLIIAVIFVVILIYSGVIKNPLKTLPSTVQAPTVPLKTQYQNPFDKSSQYVNPFSTYKNPFDSLK